MEFIWIKKSWSPFKMNFYTNRKIKTKLEKCEEQNWNFELRRLKFWPFLILVSILLAKKEASFSGEMASFIQINLLKRHKLDKVLPEWP